MEQNNLKYALIMGVESEISEYYDYALSGREHQFSNRYNRQKKRILQRAEKMTNERRVVSRARPRATFRRAVAIAAVIVLMLATASTVVAIVKPEIFYNIKEMITDWSITFDENEAEKTDFEYVTPPIPDGYEIVAEEKGTASYFVTLRNKEGQELDYEQYEPEGTMISIDNEQAEPEKEMIGDQEIITWERDDMAQIVFTDDRYVYYVGGTCGMETAHDLVVKMLEP